MTLAGCSVDPQVQTPPATEYPLQVANVVDGLMQPVAVAYDTDGVGYIVQQTGTVLRWSDDTLHAEPFLNVTHLLRDQEERYWEQGLLDLQWHPQDPTRFYVTYTPERHPETNSQRVALAEFQHDPVTGTNTHIADLFDVSKSMPYHNGGNIEFDVHGHLYVSIGDGSPFGTNRDGSFNDPDANAQDPSNLLGSILRITPTDPGEYVIPPDNPFAGEPGARQEIWMLGMRNPFQFTIEPDGDMWVGDVGSFRKEEINRLTGSQQAGANLGWPWYEGSTDITAGTGDTVHPALPSDGVDPDDYVFPVWEYENPESGCVVVAGFTYRSDEIEALKDTFLVGDYCAGKLWGLKQENGTWTNTPLMGLDGVAVSAIEETPAGEILILDHVNGRILEVRSDDKPARG